MNETALTGNTVPSGYARHCAACGARLRDGEWWTRIPLGGGMGSAYMHENYEDCSTATRQFSGAGHSPRIDPPANWETVALHERMQERRGHDPADR